MICEKCGKEMMFVGRERRRSTEMSLAYACEDCKIYTEKWFKEI